MKAPIRKVRCAVYTRVSTDERLDMEFNTPRRPARGGRSPTSEPETRGMDWSSRPLRRRRLLRWINGASSAAATAAGYRVRRRRRHRRLQGRPALSRSLIDFARIVEVFEKHNVSFVSITQQFNTTTSMGRLTLNILLSFAQFEREVIGERIRDKFAASRRKGMWMGGTPPLGYDVRTASSS